MWGPARAAERELGLALWDDEAPRITRLRFTVAAGGEPALDWTGLLTDEAISVDQRIKAPELMDRLDGEAMVIHPVTAKELDALHAEFDGVIVSTGKGDLGRIFPTNTDLTVHTGPPRHLSVIYLRDVCLGDDAETARFTLIPGVGEFIFMPTLSLDGPCLSVLIEAVPGGSLDRFGPWAGGPGRAVEPEDHLTALREIVDAHLPWMRSHFAKAIPSDDRANLVGRFTPTVRHPVATLPGGGSVVGLGDAVMVNDPISAQGANVAALSSAHFVGEIDSRCVPGKRFGTEDWHGVTEGLHDRLQVAVDFTNAFLNPLPPHFGQVLDLAGRHQPTADRLANEFADPTRIGWAFDPVTAGEYVEGVNAQL